MNPDKMIQRLERELKDLEKGRLPKREGLNFASGASAIIVIALLITLFSYSIINFSGLTGFAIVGSAESQESTFQILAGSTSATTAISPVNINTSFLICKTKNDANQGTEPDVFTATCKFLNETAIIAERYQSDDDMTVSYQVVNASNINVQNGSTTMASGSTTSSVDLGAAVNTSASFIIFTQRLNTGSNGQIERLFHTAQFIDSDTIFFNRSQSGSEAQLEWYVVEFTDGTTVQSKEADPWNIDTGGLSITDSLDAAVNDSNSWLVYNYRVSRHGLSRISVAGEISNSNTVNFFKRSSNDETPDPILNVRWYVIEFPTDSNSAVIRGNYSTSANSDYTTDITIPEVNISRSFSYHGAATSTGSGNGYPRQNWINYLTSSTNLHLERGRRGTGSDVAWQIITWPLAEEEDLPEGDLSLNDSNGTSFNATVGVIGESGDIQNLSVTPTDDVVVEELIIINHNSTSGLNTILFENSTNDEEDLDNTWSVELTDLDFEFVNITFTAQGNYLFKCPIFNFTTQNCIDDDNYTLIASDLVPGQTYSILLDAADPSFGETITGPDNISDSWFRGGNVNQNRGALSYIRTGRTSGVNNIRGIIEFNLTTIPTIADVQSAVLELYFFRIPGSDNTSANEIGVHRVQQSPARPWEELEVTWVNYTESDLWSSAGGDFNSTATDIINLSSGELSSFVVWNVTADVADFVANPSTNFGWIMKAVNEIIDDQRRDFRSKNYGTASQHPRLVVNYTVPDFVPPSVFGLIPLAGSPYSILSVVEIAANVTDDIGVSSVLANISYPNGTLQQITLSNAGGDKYNSSFSIPALNGTFNVLIIADDTSGNLNQSETTYFDVSTPVEEPTMQLYKIYDDWLDKDVKAGGGKGYLRTIITTWNNVTSDKTLSHVSDVYSVSNIVGALVDTNPAGATLTGTSNVSWTGAFNILARNFSVFSYDWHTDTANSGGGSSVDVNASIYGDVNKSRLDSIDKGGAGGANAAYLLSQISKDGGTTFDFNVQNINGSDTVTFEMRAESCQESGKVSTSPSPEMTVRIPAGWNVTAAAGWTQSPSPCSSTLIGCTLTQSASGDEFKDFQGSASSCYYTTDGGQPWTATDWQFTAIAPNPALRTAYVFNTTIDYEDSSSNAHETVGEHLVVLNQNQVPPAITFVAPTPANNSFQSPNVTINVTVVDDIEAASCVLEFDGVNETMSVIGSGASLTCTKVKTGLADGQHTFKVYASDTTGNYNNTELRTFTVDETNPSVVNLTPEEGTHFFHPATIEIRANVTDNLGVGSAYVNITFPNGTIEQLTLSNALGDIYNNSFTLPPLAGKYNLSYFANDSKGNINSSEESFFMVNDTQNPLVFDLIPSENSSYNISTYIEIGANVTDDGSVNYVYVNVTLPNGSVEQVELSNSEGDKYNVSYFIPGLEGQYNVTFFANDSANNINDTETTFYAGIDQLPPNIFALIPPAGTPYAVLNVIEIGANVTDDSAIDTVYSNVTYPNGTVEYVLLSLATGDKYNSTFTVPNLEGNYNITYFANDTFNNINSTAFSFFVVGDDESPLVFDVAPIANTTFNGTDTIEIAANVTDNGAVDTVLAILETPEGSFQEIVLSLALGDRYNTSFNANLTGRYNVTFEANDTLNNLNNTVTTYFFIVDNVPPTSTSPPDQSVEMANSTTIQWTLYDDFGPGQYYVEKEGSLFSGPSNWMNASPFIVIPNTYFLGTFNYTIFFNDSAGNEGTPDTVLVTVEDTDFPSCGDFFDENAPLSSTIDINGDFSDWDSILASGQNVKTDLTVAAGDLDDDQEGIFDMTEFAYTWDDEKMYFFYRRLVTDTNQLSMLAYLDYDLDGYMNGTDKVLEFRWKPSDQTFDTYLYSYSPDVGTGDLMNGSGFDMPGETSLDAALDSTFLLNASPAFATRVETFVNWSSLGFDGPVPVIIHPAATKGEGHELPEELQDNIGEKSTSYSSIFFDPGNTSKTASNGSSVFYVHDILNCGLANETVDFINLSLQGYNITLYYANGTVLGDSNSNNLSDILIGSDNFTTIVMQVDIPGNTTQGTIEITNLTAIPENNPNSTAEVIDTTTIGTLLMNPESRTLSSAAGLTIYTNFTISNFQGFADVVEVQPYSSLGWNVTLFYVNGTALGDSDNDTFTDLGSMLNGESHDLIVRLIVPSNATFNSTDTTSIVINSSVDPSLSATSFIYTNIKNRISIEPNYTRSVGIDSSTFYDLTVSNNYNESDTIDLYNISILGYETTFYESDKVTLLNDTDSDGFIDVGELGPSGGSKVISVKVTVPGTAVNNDEENTTVFANSSIDNLIYDTALLQTIVKDITTYEDASRSTEKSIFEIEDIVYVRAYSLTGISQVYFEWIDPEGVTQRVSPDVTVTPEYDADDQLDTNITLRLGLWEVVVFNTAGGAEISRTNFTILDTQNPLVTIVEPQDLYVNNSDDPALVEFECNATDNYFLQNISLLLTDPSNNNYQLNQTSFVNNTANSSIFALNLSEGTYTWSCFAQDTSGNIDYADVNRTILIDAGPPNVTLIEPANDSIVKGPNVSLIANGTDTLQLANATLYFNISGTFVANQTIDMTGTSNQSVFDISGITSTTELLWNVQFCDTANNCAFAPENFTVLVDSIAPTVALDFPPNDTQQPANLTFIANITEDVALDNATLYTNISGAFVANSSVDLTGLTNQSIFSLFEIPDNTSFVWNVFSCDSVGNCDFAPFNYSVFTNLSAFDFSPPVVDLDTPPNSSQRFENITFVANVSDLHVQLANATLYTNLSGVFEANESLDLSGTVNQSIFTLYHLPDNTSFVWNVYVCDTSGNCAFDIVNFTVLTNFSAFDFSPPVVDLDSPPNGSQQPGNITFVANVSDLHVQLANSTLYTNLSGVFEANESLDLSGTVNQSIFNLTDLPDNTSFVWNVYACDAQGNCAFDTVNFTVLTNFSAFDFIPPKVDLYLPPNGSQQSENITFIANLTENVDLANATFYSNLSGIFEANASVNVSGQINQSTFNLIGLPDNTSFVWNVYACDTSGNCAFDTVNFTVLTNFSAFDFSAPIVDLDSPPNGSQQSENLTFVANVTDLHVQIANATLYTNLSGVFEANSSINLSGTENQSVFNIYHLPDNTSFVWNVYACDTSGNCAFDTVNFTVLTNFSAFDFIPPAVVLDSPPNATQSNSSDVTFVANLTDDALLNATLYTNLSGLFEANFTVNVSGTLNQSIFNLSGLPDNTSFVWNVFACDTSGNCAFAPFNFTLSTNFTVDDQDAPNIILYLPPNGSTVIEENITFVANLTDATSLKNATLYTNLSGTFEVNTSVNLNGTVNQSIFNLTGLSDNTSFIWNVFACDSLGNCGFAQDNFTVLINFTAVLNQPPSTPILIFPNNGNNTLIERILTFRWNESTDPQNQTIFYEVNITNPICPDIYIANLTSTNASNLAELGTEDECGSYNWTVRANDGELFSNYSISFNFSIKPTLLLSFIVDEVDFGQADNFDINDTTDDNPPPLVLQNDGNVYSDIVNISANQSFFESVNLSTEYFQYKVDNTTELGSFNYSQSQITFINVSGTNETAIESLDFHNVSDTVEIDIKVEVPEDEPPGDRITSLMVFGAQT